MRLRRTAIGALSAVALVASSLAFGVTSASADIVTKVTICHRTNSNSNPYVQITPDVAGVLNGHAGHTGPVWNSTLKANHIKWGDIIPPFDYNGGSFPGMNYTDGAQGGKAILANGCNIPNVPPPPDPGSLQVTKDVVGTVSGDSLNGFNIEVTCDDGLTDVTLHFGITGGTASPISGIPDGSTCWVVEQGTGSAGFTATVTYNPTGADNTVSGGVPITSGDTTDVTVTNTFGLLASATTTQILDSVGDVVSSVPVGASVHDQATVASSPSGGTTPTGTVTFSFYTGSLNCTGTPTTIETVGLSGGVALSSSTGALAANVSYSYLAHYNGDTTYAGSDGACEPLDPTASTTPVTPVTPATPAVTPAPVVSPATVQVSPATAQVSPASAVQAEAVFTG